ncbi:MAG: PorV/PorQ family protein [Elusimicrobia bacterium]|nr:PorV/PorQ family protein [Elusimicrobiota bacterium]
MIVAKRAVLSGLCLAALAAAASAGVAGTSVAPALRIGPGARPGAMGEAFVAIADDAEASAFNAGGLGFVRRKTASFMHYRLAEGVNYEYLSYAHPLGERFGLGAHLAYLYTDGIPRTLEDAGGSFDSARSVGTFTNSDLKLHFAGAYRPLDWVAAGAGLSFVQDRVDSDSASGVLFDLGAKARPWRALSAGLSLQNLGSSIGGGSAPTLLRLGVASPVSHFVTLALEYDRAFDSRRNVFSLGGEYWFHPTFAMRTGFRQSALGDQGGRRFTGGFGVRLGSVGFDYAFSPLGELGDTHRMSVSYSFGAARDEGAEAEPDSREPAPARQAPPRAESGAEDRLRDAELLLEQGDLAAAKHALRSGLVGLPADDPVAYPYYERLGTVLIKEGEYAEAREAFSTGLKLAQRYGGAGPSVAGLLAGMGYCLAQEGKASYAVKFLRRALKAGPAPDTRRQIEAQLRRLRKRP